MLRSVGVVAAGVGMVLAAPHLPGVAVPVSASATGAALSSAASAADAAAALTDPSSSAAARVPITAAELACPGLASSGSASTVVLATAPAIVPGLPRVSGAVTASSLPDGRGAAHASIRRRAAVAATTASTATVVAASGSLAPGAVATERARHTGRARALLGTSCRSVWTSTWLVAGGAQAGRREHVVLVNPGAVAASVDLAVLGAKGAVSSVNGHGIVVAPRSRRAVLLDAIAGSERSPVVHVRSSGVGVAAWLTDSWVDGLIPRGSDVAAPTAAPAREQVLAGVDVAGPATVRVAVPGAAAAAVQVRLLTTSGPRGVPHGQVRVAGGASRDISLSGLPAGSYAVQVRSSAPVVAGALLQRRGTGSAPSDLAWAGAGEPVTGLAAMALGTRSAASPASSLSLAAPGSSAEVVVTSVSASGRTSSWTVRVPADSVVSRPLGDTASVWVTSTAKTVRAAVVGSAEDGRGELVTVSPLADLPLTAPAVTFRQVP